MRTILKSTGIVAASTLASRILGFARDLLMAGFFGAGSVADVFYIAFMIPNLFRRFVAEGAFTVSFVPVYTEYLVTRGQDEARSLAQKMLTLQTLAVLVIVTAAMAFTPGLWDLCFSREGGRELGILLTRIMFPYLFFVAFIGFAMGVLNSHGRFFAPALSPVLLNMGIIAGILGLRHFFAEPIVGVAAGVLAGGLLQSLLQVPGLARSGFRAAFSLDLKHPGVRRILTIMAPTLFGTAVYLINQFVSNALAYLLAPGSVTYIYYTNRLTELVMGVFIVSLASVILPEMSRMSAERDLSRLGRLYASSLTGVLFLAVPAGAALMIIGYPIVSVFFMRGLFTAADAAQTAVALQYASLGMGSVAILRVTAPACYSLGDTRSPAAAALVSLVINAALGWILMQSSLRVAGLMLATTISSTVQAAILLFIIRRRLAGMALRGAALGASKIGAAAAIMGGALWFAAGIVDWVAWPFIARLSALAGIIAGGLLIYFGAAYALGVAEARYCGSLLAGLWARRPAR